MTDEITCPACAGRHVEVVEQWRVEEGHHAAACLDCGLLFVHPPAPQEIHEAYDAPGGGWQTSRIETSQEAPQTRTSRAAPVLMAALEAVAGLQTVNLISP